VNVCIITHHSVLLTQNCADFFIVSSDFCHWGSRFRYQPHDSTKGSAIHEYIRWLDHRGMTLIESQDITGFENYLREHRNTICGRHPICVFMRAMRHASQTNGSDNSNSNSHSSSSNGSNGRNGYSTNGKQTDGKGAVVGGSSRGSSEGSSSTPSTGGAVPEGDFSVVFVQYAQSSACMSKTDSSVSYASALISQELTPI
jgi:predicted class III extradiol MEMO1 family dioxygenase